HQHPELGFQETATAGFVAGRLRALGCEDIRTGVAKTGVTALIRGTAPTVHPTKTVMIRADMDALPIEEENDVEYRSTVPGTMHACGHDAHVAMLLGAARVLNERRDRFAGTVKLLFQPGEEGYGGARAMVDSGALEDPNVDATFGLHIWQGADLGTVWARAGTAMVGSDGFQIVIRGKGGHGARPQSTVDPVAVGAELVTAVQTLVSRESDPTVPAVVSICAFNAGEAANVIPDTAVLRGTTRTVTQWQRDEVKERLEALVRGIAGAMRAEIDLTMTFGAPPVVNDPAMTEIVRAAAAEVVGAENAIEGPLQVVSEDYSEFLNRVPGCFFFVGSRNRDRGLVWGHHHPRFDVDEDALAIGVETMTRTVLRYLGPS
ncbi:MAG TPA: amidohydrolase, partial [Thermomicrobiales bacterium]